MSGFFWGTPSPLGRSKSYSLGCKSQEASPISRLTYGRGKRIAWSRVSRDHCEGVSPFETECLLRACFFRLTYEGVVRKTGRGEELMQ